ncbi:type II CRISPR RNA-guided endonuclease Cas9 [Flavobacterium sp.]|uniref:type II CRISPR RNA-guided endonuclease Cas9 n=1 Tax=Flavobacterium sp. TaxID=239 RepID=UPI00286D8AE7|nr:type II CRISPR RNA-guided endonuclease Cas9 [Flavobacterium sp.]
MAKILGLDLGTNSIGWAIVDDVDRKIIDSGVRIFPEGVVAKTIGQGEKEESKNASRRKSRQQRRGFYRKRLRKIKLLRTLINLNICPLTHNELDIWSKWDKEKKKDGRMAPEIHLRETHSYCLWLRQNPYLLRDKALNEDLTLEEFGRVLYHLIQRRGFLSNRKGKDDGKIYKGKDGVKGIEDTQKEIENSTLGRYLFDILPKEGEPFKVIQDEKGNELRVRSRYTLRDMYIAEFEAIWQRQAMNLKLENVECTNEKKVLLKGGLKNKRNSSKIAHLQKIKGEDNIEVIELNDELSKNDKQKYLLKIKTQLPLKEFLAGKIDKDEAGEIKFKSNESVLFWQRPLRSQKGLLAKCRFESDLKDENGKHIQKGKTPCHLSHPLFEEYRALQYINTIEYGKKQRLDESQRSLVLELINSKDKKFDFTEIKKKLKLEYETFNYEDKSPVTGNYTTKHLNALFPKKLLEKEFTITVNKEKVIEYGYERIWHLFHFCEDNDKLIKSLKKLINDAEIDFDFNETAIKSVESINLKEGYSNVSLKAIKNINPYLKKGLKLSDAIILAGVRNAFGKKWELYKNDHIDLEKDLLNINHEKGNKEGQAIEKIKNYLIENKYGFFADDVRFKKLYHHSQEVIQVKIQDKLDAVENLRNPIVQQGVNETKRLVNELMAREGKFDQIRVELGRDLKNSKTKREELGYKIRDNEKKNDKARELLIEFGLRQSMDNVQKVLLYQEMPISICPYTNKTINISDLLGGKNKFQVEHIIPKSISLDDSFANKTLCDSKFNGLKGNKTPHDYYEINKDPNLWGGAKSWEEIERRAFKVLPYAKAKRFASKTKFETNDFIQRQLNDTRYISKKTSEILSQVCADVRVMPGSLTAELRRLWGLNNILQPIMTVDIPNLHIEPNKHIPHYVVLDNNKKPVLSQRIYFDKPSTNENETLLSGSIDKGVFKSKEQYVKFQVEAPDLVNGDYWAKLLLSNPKSIIQVFRDKPPTADDKIVLRGKIEKGKFKNDGLNAIDAVGEDNGTYWATLTIQKKEFKKSVKEDQPKKNGKQILLFGEVKEGLFSSYIYECEAELEDGKYWLTINVDFEKVSFEKALNERPLVKENQILIQGTTNDENIFVSDMDNQHYFEMEEGKGKYYVLFDIVSEVTEFSPVKTIAPVLEDGQSMEQGTAWVDIETGEIKFDPIKNREDHRHHAIDALVIALTKESFFQRLSKQSAAAANKKRENEYEKEQLKFPEPWDDFHTDAKNSINSILISHKLNKNILTKITKKITKNGQTFKSEGMAVRGQLHKENLYGDRTPPNGKKGFHKRESVESLKTDKQLEKIVDTAIKEIIIKARKAEIPLYKEIDQLAKQLKSPRNTEIEEKEIKGKIEALHIKIKSFYTLPNKKGEPVPIKKVRVTVEMGNAQQLKSTKNQYVNPRNNHHALVFVDDCENYNFHLESFWKVVKRKQQQERIYQIPNEFTNTTLIETIEKTEMFLLGLSETTYRNNINNITFLKEHLYKAEAISSTNQGKSPLFEFRHHLESSQSREYFPHYIRITSLGEGKNGWKTQNPIKVKISSLGKIQKL